MKIQHFVFTSVLLGALVSRTSLLDGYPPRFWSEIRKSTWSHVRYAFGDDQFQIFFWGSLFITVVWYWIIGAFFTVMDLFLVPGMARKYKIQPGTNEPLEPGRLMQVIRQVLYNQFVVGIPVIYLGGTLMLWRKPPPLSQLPDAHWVLLQFVFSTFVEEIGYYYIHRLFHSGFFYRAIHKRHHEWTSPVAITAMYCHPIEQAFANLLPIFLGPFILNAHVSTYLTWFAIAVVFTLSEHSGYHLPFMTSSEYHDYHHYRLQVSTKTLHFSIVFLQNHPKALTKGAPPSYLNVRYLISLIGPNYPSSCRVYNDTLHFSFTNNFGFLGIMDTIHNTNDRFKKSVVSSRHFILKSFKSAREHVPDSVGKAL